MNIKVNSCVDCPFCRAYNVPLLDRSESPFMRGAVHKVYECNLQENSPVADDVSHLFSACPLLLGSGVATVSLASVKTIAEQMDDRLHRKGQATTVVSVDVSSSGAVTGATIQ